MTAVQSSSLASLPSVRICKDGIPESENQEAEKKFKSFEILVWRSKRAKRRGQERVNSGCVSNYKWKVGKCDAG